MLNLLSWLFGLVSIVFLIPSIVPFFGWTNWVGLPFVIFGVIFGVILGALSSHDSGRNFCLIMLIVLGVRLSIGGGIV
ncbi:MAG: hypothetical protein AAFO28_04980 [Pseudomonadota bacterium]